MSNWGVINLVDNKNFIEDVNEQASLIISQIKKEIATYEKDEINIFKASLEKEIDAYYEGELNDLRLKAQTTISQNKLDNKRKLLKIRTDLSRQLFAEAEDKLLAFSAGPNYRAFLQQQLQDHFVNLTNGYFEVRKLDLELFRDILKDLRLANEVQEGDIRLGGFKYTSQQDHIQLDETLDSRLLEQESWFMDHSGFIL